MTIRLFDGDSSTAGFGRKGKPCESRNMTLFTARSVGPQADSRQAGKSMVENDSNGRAGNDE
jgi:hypothetical protein